MNKKKIFLFTILIALLVVLCSCQVNIKLADPKVTEITVTGISNTVYTASEELDLTGASLLVKYDNNQIESIELKKDYLVTSSFDMNKPGEYAVKVSYGGKETTFNITVENWVLARISLGSIPYVTTYVVGEEINTQGATILCEFDDNKKKIYSLTKDMVQTYDRYSLGKKKIISTFHGTSLEFEVEYIQKTAKKIEIIQNAKENSVFIDKGNEYNIEGMTVRISYDNSEMPVENATNYKNQIAISIDDSTSGPKEGVLLYNPEGYVTTHKYTYYGKAYIKEGDTVTPDTKISSNSTTRDGKVIALDDVVSKSYGTVTSITKNSNGSSTLTVDTLVSYDYTIEHVKEGQIVPHNMVVGELGSQAIRAKGGGIVESIRNGKINIRTYPTTTFTTNVKTKSYERMEISTYPNPEKYPNTSLQAMIEGDTLDRSTGIVRVYYDDKSTEDFKMDDKVNIQMVNADALSVNESLNISTPGRHEIWICFKGVLNHHISLNVNVDSKYPKSLEIESQTDVISGHKYYFGDELKLQTMRYKINFNNDTSSEYSQITLDMIKTGYSINCPNRAGETDICFVLPERYRDIVPEGIDYETSEDLTVTLRYTAVPQPIDSAQFISKPSLVYVDSITSIDFDDTEIMLSYRNGDIVNIKQSNKPDLFNITNTGVIQNVSSWDEVDERIEQLKVDVDSERMYVFVLENANIQIDVNDIINNNTHYVAKLVYFDNNAVNTEPISFNYYILSALDLVETIKFHGEVDPNSQAIYKTKYTQYEDWDLTGMYLDIQYKNNALTERIPITVGMIYKGDTNKISDSISVGFTYLGAKTNDNEFFISVEERKPMGIGIIKTGKNQYLNTDITGMRFNDYIFTLKYNAGHDINVTNLSSVPNRETRNGWWYKMYDVRGKEVTSMYGIVGTVIFRMFYSYADENSPRGYSYISTPAFETVYAAINNLQPGETSPYSVYSVVVEDRESSIVAINYLPNHFDADLNKYINNTHTREGVEYLNKDTNIKAYFGNQTPVLCEVANGWELMLSELNEATMSVEEKYIQVIYRDGGYGYIKIENSMVSYDVNEKSTGYRRATISYRTFTCSVYIYVWEATLIGTSIFNEPKKDYLFAAISSEDDLVLDGGIVRLQFRKYVSGVSIGSMYKYVDMNSNELSYSGFERYKYSEKGSEIKIDVQFQDYVDLISSFNIYVYERQNLDLSFNNTIFFYGGATAAEYVINDYIQAFDLPEAFEGRLNDGIFLYYGEFANMITVFEYMSLTNSQQKLYVPMNILDKDSKLSLVMYIKASDLVNTNYIDPASGNYYVKYGTVAFVTEDRYEMLSSDCKELFNEVSNYNYNGTASEKTYVLNYELLTADEKLIIERAGNKEYVKIYHEVPISKISSEEYDALSQTDKDTYDDENNAYYIMVVVVDTRKDAERFYYSTGYALKTYTIIQKVISVTALSPTNTTAHYVTVSTKLDNNENGNPYAILYLQRPERFRNVLSQSEYYVNATFVTEVYITSIKVESFEILLLLNNQYDKDNTNGNKDSQDTIIAGIIWDILNSLRTTAFRNTMKVTIGEINYNYLGEEYFLSGNVNNDIGNIKNCWKVGINSFTDEQKANGDYHITYLINYGELLTRRGVLQLPTGELKYVLEGGSYVIKVGTLNHSSYKIDLTILN